MGYSQVCAGLGDAGAAAYEGKAPHYLDVEVDRGFTASNAGETDIAGSFNGTDGDTEPQSWVPLHAQWVQLVACVTTTQTGVRVGTCTFNSGSVALNIQRFTITLRVARTGVVLGRPVTITGEVQDCPFIASSFTGGPIIVYTSLATGQLKQAIGKYVDLRHHPKGRAPAPGLVRP